MTSIVKNKGVTKRNGHTLEYKNLYEKEGMKDMMKEEFIERVNALLEKQGRATITDINDDIYHNKIEFVYAFHPAFDGDGAKDKIAAMYVDFGLTVISDMVPRAKMIELKETEILSARNTLEVLLQELQDIKTA